MSDAHREAMGYDDTDTKWSLGGQIGLGKKRGQCAERQNGTNRPKDLKYKCRVCDFCGKPKTKFGCKHKYGKRPAKCNNPEFNQPKRKREDFFNPGRSTRTRED